MSGCQGVDRQGSCQYRYVIHQKLSPSPSGGLVESLTMSLTLDVGLLERENATILNASLLTYASQVVAGFIDSVHQLQLDCPLFLTSNDGTLMTCDQAVKYPIKTFSSGPTNSMRGANFLASWASGGPRKETALVVDVGGTTVSQVSYLNLNLRSPSLNTSGWTKRGMGTREMGSG